MTFLLFLLAANKTLSIKKQYLSETDIAIKVNVLITYSELEIYQREKHK